jgi:hypothetical protein
MNANALSQRAATQVISGAFRQPVRVSCESATDRSQHQSPKATGSARMARPSPK